MPFRSRAACLPPVLHDAIIETGDGFRLRLAPGHEVALDNDGPVRAFVEGWSPGPVLTLFQPLLLLEFRHLNGHSGFWLLDMNGRFLGNDPAALPAALLAVIRRRAGPALAWLEAVAVPGVPCEPPEAVEPLLAMDPRVRREIARVVRGHPLDDRVLSPPPDAILQAADADAAALAWFANRTITQNAHPMVPGEGWRIARVRTRLAPLVVLELAHRDGHQGLWYVDRQANYVGNDARQLVGGMRAHLAQVAAGLFDSLWNRLVLAPGLEPGPDLAWLLDCAVATRRDLLEFHLSREPAARAIRWPLTEPPPPALSYTVPLPDGGRAVLDPDHTRALCLQFLRTELFRLLDRGTLSWPSPVDGRPILAPARTLYFDDLCFAYQVHDPRHDLTFFVFAGAHFFRTFAVYFPGADLVVGLDDHHLDEMRPYCDRVRQRLLGHLVEHGNDVARALTGPPGPVVHAFRGRGAIHLGHYVWQDLSGVSFLVDAFPPEKLPEFHVFDSQEHPELYGPLDEIFPELAGKVVRHDHNFSAHVGAFYRARQSVIKSTSISVPAQVGRRIIAALHRSERWAEPVARAAAAAAAGPVVLLGLRIGNRTIEDMQGFAEALVSMLVDTLGALTVVIDGHNSVGDAPGTTYASFGDTLTGGSAFLQREKEIAAALRRRFANGPATIIDNIGRTIQESVIWCSEADFFVAPWGAALAKYRWVCNRPGLVTAGRWNLENRHDLGIYHHPNALENPAPMLFNAPGSAVDVDGQEPDRSNYTLDLDAVFAQVRQLADAHVRPRPALQGPAPRRRAARSRAV